MEINLIMLSKLKKILMDNLELLEKDVYIVDGLFDLKDLMLFLGLLLFYFKDLIWIFIMLLRL